jgi:hypothetical protein
MKTILQACWELSGPFFRAMNWEAYMSKQCYALECNDLEDFYGLYMSGGEL